MNDELDQLKPTGVPVDMQCWNIEDLQCYVKAMQTEITRVEGLMSEKNRVQLEANVLFSPSPD